MGNALNFNGVGTRAADVGAHGVEEVGEIDDVRLLGRVFDHGVSLRQNGGHHDVHGRAHGNHIQIDAGAVEPGSLTGGVDKAALHHHVRAQRGKALDVLVDGAHAEVAAAGHGDLRPVEPAQQGADQIIGRADAPRQLIGGAGGADVGAVDLHRVGIDCAHARAQLSQDLQKKLHVGDLRDILDTANAVHQQRGGQDGHRRVLRAADLHLAEQGLSAPDHILCQAKTLSLSSRQTVLSPLFPFAELPYPKTGG